MHKIHVHIIYIHNICIHAIGYVLLDNILTWGWSGGAMVLGKLPVPGRPNNLGYSRARVNCAFSGCRWGLFGHFSLVYHFSLLSPSL